MLACRPAVTARYKVRPGALTAAMPIASCTAAIVPAPHHQARWIAPPRRMSATMPAIGNSITHAVTPHAASGIISGIGNSRPKAGPVRIAIPHSISRRCQSVRRRSRIAAAVSAPNASTPSPFMNRK